jgi:hypothetical protein
MWAGWSAYAEGVRDVLNLKELSCWNKYQIWEDASKEGGFRYMHEEFCIVSDFPEILKIDERNRPHNEHGPSHRWRDGFEIYHLHGVRFPKELYLKVISREMEIKDILAIQDIDQRTQAMKFAKSGIREFYKAENGECIDELVKLDKNGSPVKYELWKIPKGNTFNKDVHFMIYDCPSARERGEKREYTKGVPPLKTIAECMAWGMSDDIFQLQPEEFLRLIPLEHES